MRITIALILMLGTGCAQLQYQQSIRSGARAEKRGEWAEAMEAYQRAREERPSDAAEDGYQRALEALVAETLDAAKAAIGSGAYEVAYERLELVQRLDDDQIEVHAMRKQIEETLATRAEETFQVGDADGSYALAIRLRTLFPNSKSLPPLIASLRTHYVTTASARRNDGMYAEAMDAVGKVRKMDPEAEAMIAPVEEAVRGSWAEQLAETGQAHLKAERYAEALEDFARAYTLAGRTPHRDAAREAAEALRPRGRFKVAVEITGPESRKANFLQVLEGAGDALPELVLTDPADLRLTVQAPEPRCDEVAARTAKSVEYLAGTEEVANPDRERLQQEIDAAAKANEAADARATELWPKVEALRKEVESAQRELDAAERERKSAQRKEDSAREQYDAAQKLIGEGSADADAVVKHVREWEAALTEARTEREKTDKVRDQADAKVKKAKEELEAVQKAYQQAMEERDAQNKARSSLMGDLRNAPRTVTREIRKRLDYDVEEWTRTCHVRAVAQVMPTWSSSLPSEDRYSPSRETQDTAHIGHDLAGIKEDPKAYPLSDEQMVADADNETAKALLGWLGRLADERYAILKTDLLREPFSTDSLAMYVGAPKRVDQDVRAAMAKEAKERGIDDLDGVLGLTW